MSWLFIQHFSFRVRVINVNQENQDGIVLIRALKFYEKRQIVAANLVFG